MDNIEIWNHIPLREDDIVIASTVKSGTTWLQQIISQIVFEGEFDGNLSDISPWVDSLRDHSEEEILEILDKQKHRRYMKTHSPASTVLTKNIIKNGTKCIFITRDFRDVIWSFYNHFRNSKYALNKDRIDYEMTKRLRATSTPHEFWHMVMENPYMFKINHDHRIVWSYFNVVKSWLMSKARDTKGNILILHFADLKADLYGNIIKICKYLGYDYGEDILDKIYEKSTFSYMKKNSDNCVPKNFIKRSSSFINKGSNKRWLNVLNDEDQEEYKELIRIFFSNDIIDWIENGSMNSENSENSRKIEK